MVVVVEKRVSDFDAHRQASFFFSQYITIRAEN